MRIHAHLGRRQAGVWTCRRVSGSAEGISGIPYAAEMPQNSAKREAEARVGAAQKPVVSSSIRSANRAAPSLVLASPRKSARIKQLQKPRMGGPPCLCPVGTVYFGGCGSTIQGLCTDCSSSTDVSQDIRPPMCHLASTDLQCLLWMLASEIPHGILQRIQCGGASINAGSVRHYRAGDTGQMQ